jgi:hypothetical protein
LQKLRSCHPGAIANSAASGLPAANPGNPRRSTVFRRDRNFHRQRGDSDYETILAGIQRERERYRQVFAGS